ncbi:hypothetical protein RND81_04G014900 [Saponaria officinalis]|uniref:CCHC-type domain-containing protein n=1 Tax=Saponaria officinalis TaxID=3572 RepID=A0AAW1LGK1_SAPOF
MEEKLNGITEVINVLVGAINKLTADKIQHGGGARDDEEVHKHHNHDDTDQQIKVELPDFHGTLNLEELLEWLRAVERIFEYKGYDDAKKFMVAILKFKGYASLWYEGVKQQRAQTRKEPLKSWEKLKKKLQAKSISADYTQELFLRLTHLRQNEGSVDSYQRDFEQLTLQCEIQERPEPEQKISRFLEGLDSKISGKVRLQPLWSFDEVVRLAQRVEKQGKGRVTQYKTPVKTPQWKQYSTPRTEPPERDNKTDKGKEVLSSPLRNSVGDLRRKCYQCQGYGHFSRECPINKTLTLIDIQELEAQEELMTESTEVATENDTQKEVILPPDEGVALVVYRVMHSQPTPMEEDQRQQIFQTRCTVMGKLCHVLVDSGSCTNAASTVLVEKLNLPTINNPQPYKLRWLSKGTEVQVDKQVLLPFSIGKTYSDQVLDVTHYGRDNTYSFKHEGRKVTLTLLAPFIYHRSGPEISKKPKESLLLMEAEFVKEASRQGVIYALLTKEVRGPQAQTVLPSHPLRIW